MAKYQPGTARPYQSQAQQRRRLDRMARDCAAPLRSQVYQTTDKVAELEGGYVTWDDIYAITLADLPGWEGDDPAAGGEEGD